MGDKDVEQRTLRGNDPMTTHINTIVGYSLLWLLGVWKNYQFYGDVEFVRELYPKMKRQMAFCDGQTQEHGFQTGQEKDWIYIDWADFDKEGPFCAEPHTELVPRLDCTLPLGEGSVRITWDENSVKVETGCRGGVLQINGREAEICGTVQMERGM